MYQLLLFQTLQKLQEEIMFLFFDVLCESIQYKVSILLFYIYT